MTCTPKECFNLKERAAIMTYDGRVLKHKLANEVIKSECTHCDLREGRRLSDIMKELKS